MIINLLKILVFPGLAFLIGYALVMQYIDRKLNARMQNRVGPPFIQPLADLVKLLSKETIVPEHVDALLFRLLPYFSFTFVATAFMFIPVMRPQAVYSLNGDLVIAAYLLTMPSLIFALAGMASGSTYSMIGGVRSITQLFAYEIPFLISLLIPSMLMGTWNISEIGMQLPGFLAQHPARFIPVVLAFLIALVSLQGKLERKPFDIPDAETEIVAGPFVEYSGRLYAIFRLSLDMELVVGASLVSAVFLGGPHFSSLIAGFLAYLVKTLFILVILSYFKAATARIRIDQMISFCWSVLAPLSLAGIILAVLMHGGI